MRHTKPYNELDDPQQFDRLTAAVRRRLLRWIAANVEPARAVCRWSSYGLKHEFEAASGGFYAVNGAFKGAMAAAGFAPVDEGAVNWQFRARAQRPANTRTARR